MVTVTKINDENLIEEFTITTLKKLDWVDPRKIPLEVEQYKTIPFFAIKYNDIYLGYAIILIHNEYVAELQANWHFYGVKFNSYNEFISEKKVVSKAISQVCKDYCNSRGINLLYYANDNWI